MKNFKFIDLFAGIGGFHLAMDSLGGECVFASESDTNARKTYEHNFKNISPALFDKQNSASHNSENNNFNDDIRSIIPEELPDFDVLCAGFPCQPFSQAGHKRGFADNHKSERGNLFFNIVDIIEAKRPKAFFLENVRGIVSHDNGKTFNVIRELLEDELGYSFYYKVVKASDYGLPQLRPRAFMIGFRDEDELGSFQFPPALPLKFTMSDVWGGECSREIGFTIRVGGRGSNINDRRNWDAYLVDNKVRKLSTKEAKQMQGFPESFEFPVVKTQAMKQLGNSVAIDAVVACASNLLAYMAKLKISGKRSNRRNKGEWSEFLSFIKLLHDEKIELADKYLKPTGRFINVSKVTTRNSDYDCILEKNCEVIIASKSTDEKRVVPKKDIVTQALIDRITKKIKAGRRTFEIEEFKQIEKALGFSMSKGGNSYQKADIVLDIENDVLNIAAEGFGIKSYLGSKPSLLNASGSTNFIYKVTGLARDKMDEVNAIKTRHKLTDRLERIYALGGELVFERSEKENLAYNLSVVDPMMPEIVSAMLYEYFINRSSKISKNIKKIHARGTLNKKINYGDLANLESKVKRLLVATLLGFFPSEKWDGKYKAKGIIVVKKKGKQVGFHMSELKTLEDYLYKKIKFDSPSSKRHRYGSLFVEKSGDLFFKLNLQLRF